MVRTWRGQSDHGCLSIDLGCHQEVEYQIFSPSYGALQYNIMESVVSILVRMPLEKPSLQNTKQSFYVVACLDVSKVVSALSIIVGVAGRCQ